MYFNRITKQINCDAFSDTLCSYSSLKVCGRKLNKVLKVDLTLLSLWTKSNCHDNLSNEHSLAVDLIGTILVAV